MGSRREMEDRSTPYPGHVCTALLPCWFPLTESHSPLCLPLHAREDHRPGFARLTWHNNDLHFSVVISSQTAWGLKGGSPNQKPAQGLLLSWLVPLRSGDQDKGPQFWCFGNIASYWQYYPVIREQVPKTSPSGINSDLSDMDWAPDTGWLFC